MAINAPSPATARQLLMRCPEARRRHMLETIAIILIILWLLGMVSGYTLGNFIYILLVVAIVLFLVRIISGRRV
jgi:low affinity Fe/Cu permease